MKKQISLKLKLELCDRNRSFEEILESILKAISERDGVDSILVMEEIWK